MSLSDRLLNLPCWGLYSNLRRVRSEETNDWLSRSDDPTSELRLGEIPIEISESLRCLTSCGEEVSSEVSWPELAEVLNEEPCPEYREPRWTFSCPSHEYQVFLYSPLQIFFKIHHYEKLEISDSSIKIYENKHYLLNITNKKCT